MIELEADRMVNLRLSPDLIERERGAVLGEMKMYKDMPSEQVWESLMAAAYPKSRFTGYEFRGEALDQARAKASAQGSSNVRFASVDISKLNEPAAYDLVMAFDVIHDQAHPRTVLKNVATALRLGGTFLMQDIKASSHVHENLEHPMAPFLYAISTMHCMTVSLALDGEGLGTMWGEQRALELLGEAGFSNVAVEDVEGDPLNSYYIAAKG